MLLLIIVGTVLFIINPLLLVAFLLIIGIGVVISLEIDNKQTKDIGTAEIISRTVVTKQQYEHSGMSIGTRGNARFYWRTRNVPQYVEVVFRVTYLNGSIRQVKANEGTNKYDKLMSYVGVPFNVEHNDKNKSDKPEKNTENAVQSSVPAPLPEKALKSKAERISIDCSILPNEISLRIERLSCVLEERPYDDGKYQLRVMCEAYYDGTVKGITKQRIVMLLYDNEEKIIDTVPCFNNLEKSGCSVIDYTFWRNIQEKPHSISFGVERTI